MEKAPRHSFFDRSKNFRRSPTNIPGKLHFIYYRILYAFILTFLLVYNVWQLTRNDATPFAAFYDHDIGSYGDLTQAFLHGQTSMLFLPDPRLAEVENPYLEKFRKDISGAFDLSYYIKPGTHEGRYYLYHGPAPVLLLYLPLYFISGQIPTISTVFLIACFGNLLIFAALIRYLAHHYFPDVPPYLEALLILTYGLCNMFNFMECNPWNYQMAICFGATCTLATLFFLLLARRLGRYNMLWLSLASLCTGIGFASRPTCLFLNLVLVYVWISFFWQKHQCKFNRELLGQTIALFLPSLLCCLGVAWYNYVRFQNIFEFGAAYQLNGGEFYRYDHHFSFVYLPDSVWCFLLMPWEFHPHFPFFDIDVWPSLDSLSPGRFRLPTCGIFPCFPITLLAFAWGGFSRAQLPSAQKIIGFFGLIVTLWGLINFILVGSYFAVVHRYAAEFMLPLLLLTSLTLLKRRQAGPFHLWEKIILWLLFTYSLYFGIDFGLTGEGHWIQSIVEPWYASHGG